MRVAVPVSVLFALIAAAASAQTDIAAVPEGQSWAHKASGMVLPATLSGMKRDKIQYFAAAEVDEAAQYSTSDKSEILTIFLFRNVSGSLPLWFDRARDMILIRDVYGKVQARGIRTFVPRGQSVASGMLEAYDTNGPSGFTSTSVALIPLDGFYAKIRLSSRKLDASALEAKMAEIAGQLNWPIKQPYAAAAPISQCQESLPSRPDAKPAAMDKSDAFTQAIGSMVMQLAQDAAEKTTASLVPTYCREAGQRVADFAAYRLVGTKDRLLVALNDAGTALSSYPDEIGAALTKQSKKVPYAMVLINLDRTVNFAPFKSLPNIGQMIEVLNTTPISVTSTWGEKKIQLKGE